MRLYDNTLLSSKDRAGHSFEWFLSFFSPSLFSPFSYWLEISGIQLEIGDVTYFLWTNQNSADYKSGSEDTRVIVWPLSIKCIRPQQHCPNEDWADFICVKWFLNNIYGCFLWTLTSINSQFARFTHVVHSGSRVSVFLPLLCPSSHEWAAPPFNTRTTEDKTWPEGLSL